MADEPYAGANLGPLAPTGVPGGIKNAPPPPPPGFVIDSASKTAVPPPPGFKLDAPVDEQDHGWLAETRREAGGALDTIRAAGSRGDKGPIEGLLQTGKAVAAVPQLLASPLTGAIRSFGGRGIQAADAGMRAGAVKLYGEDKVPKAPTFEQSASEAERASILLPGIGFAKPARASTAVKNTVETLSIKSEQQKVSDDLFTLRQTGTADKIETGKRLEQVPEQYRNAATQERWYHAMEDPALLEQLPPAERAAFEQFITPMRKEINQLHTQIKKLDPGFEDPTYVHRIAKGHSSTYDTLSGDAYDPIRGTRSLSKTTSSLKERKFFAIENPKDGRRFVVSADKPGFNVWRDGKPVKIGRDVDLKPGTEITLDGQQWHVAQARTSEIEANSPTRYHKSAAVNTADALVRLRQVARNMQEVERLKTDLTGKGLAKKLGEGQLPPNGFQETKIPQFRGYAFEPKIAHALDDFYKPGLDGLDGLRKINQFATASIFWNPIPHIENVAAHWFVGRGFDNIRPGPIRHFATDAARAIRSAVTQDATYVDMLKKGSALVEGGVKNADFYQAMGRKFGMEIEKDWGAWKPVFDKLGLKTPYEAVAWWYDKVRNVLWTASDTFMLHRVFELERKGFSREAAIKEAERHIPNYRISPEIMGSRTFSNIMQDPAITIFSRYHYGMWKSYVNQLGDLYKGGKTEIGGNVRRESLGNMAALGFLLYGVYPAIDYGLQKLTGDENAKKLRRGAASVPSWLNDLYQGDMSFPQFLANAITLAPATKEGMQQFVGKDWFTGQDIGGPVQRTEHAAQALVSPYQTFNRMMIDKPGAREIGRGVFDIGVGAANTSPATLKSKKKAEKRRGSVARKRDKKPRGLIERGAKVVRDKVRQLYEGE